MREGLQLIRGEAREGPSPSIFFVPSSGDPIPYEDFRPEGLSWDVIRAELKEEQDQECERGQYMYVSRGTVLGRWNQRKREAYRRYLADFRAGRR
jgi:hypothetical protein